MYTLGHSTHVGRLAHDAARAAGLSDEACRAVHVAGLLHDLGHVSVSTALWENRRTLTTAEWERVRLHPYFTERVLSRAPLLAPYAAIAGMHHERLDGSGYHRGAPGSVVGLEARIVAAADHYQGMREPRPHRGAADAETAARALRADVSAGRLDARAVDAVLGAAGHAVRAQRSNWPARLTDREVEVLRAVAQGASSKEVAQRLGISARTAQHHVAHIYRKIGVSSRAAAALFAIENDLIAR